MDLRNTHFQVTMAPEHKFLSRFAFRRLVFHILPLSISLALQVSSWYMCSVGPKTLVYCSIWTTDSRTFTPRSRPFRRTSTYLAHITHYFDWGQPSPPKKKKKKTRGDDFSKQRLSYWVVDIISMTHKRVGHPMTCHYPDMPLLLGNHHATSLG